MKTTRAIGLGAVLFGVALAGAGGALAQFKKPYAVRAEQAFASTDPSSTAHFGCELRSFSGPRLPCYGPDAIRKAYGLDQIIASGTDGTGQTIVIIDAYGSPTLEADLAAFDSVFGLPPPPSIQQIRMPGSTAFDPTDGNQVGWAEESSLDVQWAHAIAPGANIILVAAATNNDDDMLTAQEYAINQHLGSILSESFGESELALIQLGKVGQAIFDANEKSYNKAAAKQISVLVSSGDDGSAGFDVNGVEQTVPVANYPASSPNVTTVGGTNLFFGANGHADPNGAYLGEVVWNDGFGAGGGGVSQQFRVPDYQQGVKHLNPTSTGRGYPDVAYNAGVFGGVIVHLGFPGVPAGYYIFGGTSASAPQWAGITALINQASKHPAGFLNKSLYKLGKLGVLQPLMHDITQGDNSLDGVPGYAAAPGWDFATGWGTPNAGMLGSLIKDNGTN